MKLGKLFLLTGAFLVMTNIANAKLPGYTDGAELKTIRKKNAIMVFATQSPSDVLNNPIARTVVEQTSTQIMLPNEKADEEEYVKFFKATPEVRSLYNKFGMGDRCSRYTTRFQETCYAKAAVDATRLYSSIAGAEAAKQIAEELKEKAEQGFANANDLKGGTELIAANQQYKANLELMKENYSKNMRTLDEQMKIIEAKEELLRQEALLGKVAANP